MKKIANSVDAVNTLLPFFQGEDYENLYAILLNKAQTVIGIHQITSGTTDAVLISSKQIARVAVINNATGVIIAHNHPSNDVHPSMADIKATEKLQKALNFLEIKLLDHIVVGQNNFYSFCEERTFTL